MAPQDVQTTDIHAQATNKPMEIRPKNNPNSNTTSDSMDTSDPSNPESSSTTSDPSDSDSDSTSSNASEDEEIPTLKPGQKPDFTARVAAGAPSLEDRLKAFLPQLKEANSQLAEKGGKGQSMEDVGEDEPHIEMSLGLGLLEEKKGGDSDDDDEDDEEEDGEGEGGESGEEKKRKEKDVMGRLMGGRENQGKGIEEVG